MGVREAQLCSNSVWGGVGADAGLWGNSLLGLASNIHIHMCFISLNFSMNCGGLMKMFFLVTHPWFGWGRACLPQRRASPAK